MKYLINFFFILSAFGSIQAQRVLTRGEVFNFSINDEFHYKNNTYQQSPPPSGKTVKITSKTYSANNDTVTYEFEEVVFYTQYNSPIFSWHISPMITKSISYSNLGAPITLYNGFSQDTIRFRFDSSGTLINYYAYSVGSFEPDYFWGHYGEGIGVVDFGIAIPSNQDVSGEKLTYYKTATKEWGKRWDFPTTVEESTKQDFIQIFPNPFTNSLTFSCSKPNKISIYNILGQLVFTQNIQIGLTNVELNDLANGVYIVNSEMDGKTLKKIILKE
jgi:hypothetical protein